jgi:hypothetical protein
MSVTALRLSLPDFVRVFRIRRDFGGRGAAKPRAQTGGQQAEANARAEPDRDRTGPVRLLGPDYGSTWTDRGVVGRTRALRRLHRTLDPILGGAIRSV